MSDATTVEGTGETVGEAKWSALRELERRAPGLDKTAVQFEVLSEGERGLLGVGYMPARVVATVPMPAADAVPLPSQADASPLAEDVRSVAAKLDATGALRCLDAVQACREALELNVKPLIAVEALTAQLRLPD